MAGVTLSFKLRRRAARRPGLRGRRRHHRTGAFHEGINFAAVQRCPLVVIVENNGYAYSTPDIQADAPHERLADKAAGYGIPGVRADGNDVLAAYQVTKDAVDRARRGEGVTLIELMTYRRKGHAEHDNQSYVPAGEIDRWAAENDPLDRYVQALTDQRGRGRVGAGGDRGSGARPRSTTRPTSRSSRRRPSRATVCAGIYADPAGGAGLWYREGITSAVDRHERPASWGTHDG